MALHELDNLNIGSLALTVSNVEGHEHRIRPIAARAAAIFAERLGRLLAEAPEAPASRHVSSVHASPVHVNLGAITDEHAASSIARAWLEAVSLKLRV